MTALDVQIARMFALLATASGRSELAGKLLADAAEWDREDRAAK
jgi:hypothetical protein